MSQLSAVPDPTLLSSDAPFECTLTTAGASAGWIYVAGELDMVTSPQLARVLRAAQLHARLIVLDTREVSFIDCSGLRVILAANASVERGGQRLMLAAGSAVGRLLELAGTREQVWTFDITPSEPHPERDLDREAPSASQVHVA